MIRMFCAMSTVSLGVMRSRVRCFFTLDVSFRCCTCKYICMEQRCGKDNNIDGGVEFNLNVLLKAI